MSGERYMIISAEYLYMRGEDLKDEDITCLCL